MMIWFEILAGILTDILYFYCACMLVFYVLFAMISIGETLRNYKKNNSTDYSLLATSEHGPSVSIIAPGYNEGVGIIDNVRSLLAMYYSNLEIIIVNDGSTDKSLQKLIIAYELYKVDFFVEKVLPAKQVRGVYKSINPVYKKLIVVDKENGGKADALNAAINIASKDYIVAIDVDCILEQDALLKIIKPLIDYPKVRVIASGGVVRIANSCVVEDGKLVKVNLPKNYLARVQTLEYLRSFLLGRMAWTRLNGLLLISGAFGAFDKEIVIKCGGYNTNTVGEDMELIVRMRRYMVEKNEPHCVKYIPDPLCWTEAPSTYKILGRQRNRWMRGTIETLLAHKIICFNKRYGLMGFVSYPYWFFFEMLGPAVEFIGFIIFLSATILGIIKWSFFFSMLLFMISFGCMYSAFAILMEVLSYHQYKRPSDILKLLLVAITEPFLFHPFMVWSSIRGITDYFRNKKSWGEMTRSGFGTDISELKPGILNAHYRKV
ncbi:glycosyltransferase [Segetibacter sp.]|uniref:glycosyltransferase family 2 protein n=1 Tax=Segetibacter sp. TaxID=2231182 RepID=UPI002614B752|nr:glycosyltransferase [Segetibacter sp.]MCW3080829.1 glycosyl transferase family 2 [Segetibacter sp.]